MDNIVSTSDEVQEVSNFNNIGFHTEIQLVGNSDLTHKIEIGDFVIMTRDNKDIAAFLINEKPYGVICSKQTTPEYRETLAFIMQRLGYKSSLKMKRVDKNVEIEVDAEVQYLRDPRIERMFPTSQLPAS